MSKTVPFCYFTWKRHCTHDSHTTNITKTVPNESKIEKTSFQKETCCFCLPETCVVQNVKKSKCVGVTTTRNNSSVFFLFNTANSFTFSSAQPARLSSKYALQNLRPTNKNAKSIAEFLLSYCWTRHACVVSFFGPEKRVLWVYLRFWLHSKRLCCDFLWSFYCVRLCCNFSFSMVFPVCEVLPASDAVQCDIFVQCEHLLAVRTPPIYAPGEAQLRVSFKWLLDSTHLRVSFLGVFVGPETQRCFEVFTGFECVVMFQRFSRFVRCCSLVVCG